MNEITLPLLPLREQIVFPHMIIPLFVGREKSVNALEESITSHKNLIFVAAQTDAGVVNPEENDIYRIGTITSVVQIHRLPDNTVKVMLEGKKRARITKYEKRADAIYVTIEEIHNKVEASVEMSALIRSVKSVFDTYVKTNKRIPPEILVTVSSIDDPGKLADVVVAHLGVKIEEKQKVLEESDIEKRLQKVLELAQGEVEIFNVEKRIRTRVKQQVEKTQKEYYLNEQIQAIQKELGEKDDARAEIENLERIIKSKKLSEEAQAKVSKEIKKLKMMSPMSAEASVIRNYIDWIIALPWNTLTKDNKDLEKAENILNDDHYGLEEVKERILEYLSVKILTENKSKGSILCLSGPPGVGKTSLAKSIARAVNRRFVKISLGGVHDESEIRGHRRTYVGAMPGKIVQGMRKCDSTNPVFLMDEIDKMSNDFRGDPAAALLEVLDPEQNIMFNDHFLEVDYDLSQIMFVLTANNLYSIPRPLLDRMEVIHISGYTENEKFHIAEKYLVPKQLEAHGLKNTNVKFSKEAIFEVIRSYTRESGVRSLEREIANVCRKMTRKIVKEEQSKKSDSHKKHEVVISAEDVIKFLGLQRYTIAKIEGNNEIGITNGLAWTEVGGDTLEIETTILPGNGRLIITGQLGEVMQESATAAMTYARSRYSQFGLDPNFYQNIDVHIHIPEGAIPKDGPSAGITMATSVISALTQIPTYKTVAMTGEITLRGKVLPIGGLKEKLLAAKNAGIKTVIIPKENERDLTKLSGEILDGLTIKPVDHMDRVLEIALARPEPKAKKKASKKPAKKAEKKSLPSKSSKSKKIKKTVKSKSGAKPKAKKRK